jgi:protein phosphatase PTC7
LKGGEDAFFADTVSDSFGVADGVGGSASATTDPGIFSRSLMRSCWDSLAKEPARTSLGNVLEDAAVEVSAKKLGGSCTVLLGRLVDHNRLQIANIGDSACFVMRPSSRRFSGKNGKGQTVIWPRAVLRTADQTHYFNCPYQVCADSFMQLIEAEHVDFLEVEVQEGDIIVAATDGVFDNIFDQNLQVLVMKHLAHLRKGDVDALAAAIAAEALRIGELQDDPKVTTPFSQEARAEGYEFAGGKLDDVAVVVAVVGKERTEPQPGAALHNLG